MGPAQFSSELWYPSTSQERQLSPDGETTEAVGLDESCQSPTLGIDKEDKEVGVSVVI